MTAMEDTYILKFRLSDLGRSALKKEERQELCEEIYAKLTSVIDENEVHGLQLSPQKWPKTVILSFKNESIKNKIYMEGLDIFNRHIELQDCSETAVIKVIVYDAPVGMPNGKLREILSGYGDVINVEEEMHTFNGRVTSWSTGNRLVNMTNQKIHSTYDWSVQGATNFNQYLVSRARGNNWTSICSSDQTVFSVWHNWSCNWWLSRKRKIVFCMQEPWSSKCKLPKQNKTWWQNINKRKCWYTVLSRRRCSVQQPQ